LPYVRGGGPTGNVDSWRIAGSVCPDELGEWSCVRLPWSIRRITSQLLLRVPVRISAGPLENVRWSLAAAGRHRSGAFEQDRIAVIQQLLAPGDCLWDVGAHHGYMTLVASRRVGGDGRVCAFEPSPYNLMFLRAHVRWNDVQNVTVYPCALAGQDGRAPFGGAGSSQTQHIGGGKDIVTVRSIPSLLGSGLRPPDVLKIDAEGAEGDILRVGAPYLGDSAALLVGIHSRRAYDDTVAALRPQGFLILESRHLRERLASDEWGMLDPDIVALGRTRHGLAGNIRTLTTFRP
jgi:FkbM family methyltransferase